MPIYEYRCSKCGDFEVIQKITEKALSKCPTCKAKVSKLMSNTSFQLKGTGWYVTDYARSDKGGAAAKASSESSSSESKSESSGESSSSESKSEAKSETKTESKPKSSTPGKSKPAAAA